MIDTAAEPCYNHIVDTVSAVGAKRGRSTCAVTNRKGEIIMIGNFTYSNPTRLYFGENAVSFLAQELKNYGPKVMLTYGGGSIKRNGVYDDVIAALREAGWDAG